MIGCAIEVHRQLGPGLLESTYNQCFAYELNTAQIQFVRESPLPLHYKGIKLDWGYRVDYLIENELLMRVPKILTTSFPEILTTSPVALPGQKIVGDSVSGEGKDDRHAQATRDSGAAAGGAHVDGGRRAERRVRADARGASRRKPRSRRSITPRSARGGRSAGRRRRRRIATCSCRR